MIKRDLIIKTVESPEEFTAIKAIRIAVFQEEQGVDSALEFDGKDEISQHLIAYLNQEAVGTTRIRYLDNQTAKIERLAVLAQARKKGIGKQIMEKAIEIIASQSIPEVVIHSQEYVKSLYEKMGFIPEGEIFIEADIPHVKMKKKLWL
ncbi:GNAT family N-acetyltransferase [Calothrix sp. NIES-2100]|uniref:GNAT family N-acetyltransferase n=1 Tax=Calothrix sp. NIES-2100 TaxID=1954172 RepID=UPI000BBB845D